MNHLPKASLTLLAITLLAALSARAAGPSKYADVLGNWTIESAGQNGQTNRSTLIVKEEGGKLIATTISDRGEFVPKEVKYENGELTMLYAFEREGKTYEIVSKSKPGGEKLTGKIEFKGGDTPRTIDFTGARVSKPAAPGTPGSPATGNAAVVGTWKLKLSVPGGTTAEPVLTLTQEGGQLKGKYVSQRFGELPVTDAKVEGNKLSFKVTAKGDDGSPVSLLYHGDLAGGSVKGQADFDFGGQKGSMDFEGKKEEKAS